MTSSLESLQEQIKQILQQQQQLLQKQLEMQQQLQQVQIRGVEQPRQQLQQSESSKVKSAKDNDVDAESCNRRENALADCKVAGLQDGVHPASQHTANHPEQSVQDHQDCQDKFQGKEQEQEELLEEHQTWQKQPEQEQYYLQQQPQQQQRQQQPLQQEQQQQQQQPLQQQWQQELQQHENQQQQPLQQKQQLQQQQVQPQQNQQQQKQQKPQPLQLQQQQTLQQQQPPLQQPLQQQQQFYSQHRPTSCSYYMRLRHLAEHPEGMYTTYSPEWYISNLGFRASLWPDGHGKSYCAALHLSYFSIDTTVSFTKTAVKCKVTLMDPLGRKPDCLLAEREAVFDGNRQVVDEWARGCVMVRINIKDIKERGMCSDYTLLIRYDVSISSC